MTYPIVHVEFQVKDADKAMAWYSSVFGWPLQKDEKLHYVSGNAGEGGMGVGLNPGTMPTGAVPYVGTDDIPTILAKVEAAGGKVLQTEMAVGDMGTIALFQDPDGNTIGAANFPQM